ncbi:MAG: NIL domain-containing protein [Planctomycetota bacterium]
MTLRRFSCTFPQALISEPLISHTLGAEFGVVPNIREATISQTVAHVIVEIEGASDKVDQSIEFLEERGVTVEEIEPAGS